MKNKSFDTIEKFFNSITSGENLLNLPENRLKIYQRLVYNNIEDTCSKTFPIGKKIINKEWEDLIKNFLKKHKFKSPYLWEVPKEFINFLENENIYRKYPYLKEILIYEWIELEVFNEDIPSKKAVFDLNKMYRITNSVRLINFSYPVHRLDVIDIPLLEKLKGEYPLVIYQNPDDNEVEYIEITPLLYDLLDSIHEDKLIDVIKKIAHKYGSDYIDLLSPLTDFINLLIDRKIII